MKPRKNPPPRIRALLQKEIDSQCPFCKSQEVDAFEAHHLNEKPDDGRFENLLMVCPTCHAKITAGTIPVNEVYQKKIELMVAQKRKAEQSQDKSSAPKVSMKDVGIGIVGDHNNVTTKTIKKQVVKYPPDCIGSDSTKANYISYLIKRYNEFAKWKRDDFRYEVFNSHLKKLFKVGPQRTVYNIPLTRFEELVDYIQYRIADTRLGRIKRSSQRLFQSFAEYCAEQAITQQMAGMSS